MKVDRALPALDFSVSNSPALASASNPPSNARSDSGPAAPAHRPLAAGGRPLRIGLMTDTYLPVCNGVTHMISLLARDLASRGHEPHVFTFASPVELRVAPDGLLGGLRVPRSASPDDGVQVHRGPALPILRSGYFLGIRYPLWMKALLREMDILHVHHPFISGRLARRLRRPEQPLVFTNQTRYDIYGHYLRRMMPFVPEESLGARVTRHATLFANCCDRIIAPSASLARVLQTWGVTAPIEVIPNGIELQRFQGAPSQGAPASPARARERETQRARWSISADAPLVVYLGRLAPEKNVEMLLGAFAQARRAVPAARLLLVGDGPSEVELRHYTQRLGLGEAAHFTGAVPYDEVPAALMACDLFASCSVSEVHPLTFIEAMAAGLPCVGTPSPGVTDTVVAGRNGWLAPPATESFAAALVEALRDAGERARRGALAAEDSRAYAIEATAARTLDLYRGVLAARCIGTP